MTLQQDFIYKFNNDLQYSYWLQYQKQEGE